MKTSISIKHFQAMLYKEACSKLCQTAKMECFARTVPKILKSH